MSSKSHWRIFILSAEKASRISVLDTRYKKEQCVQGNHFLRSLNNLTLAMNDGCFSLKGNLNYTLICMMQFSNFLPLGL